MSLDEPQQTSSLLAPALLLFYISHTTSHSLKAKISQPRTRLVPQRLPIHVEETLNKCRNLHTKPGPPPDFNLRTESDRYVPGTKATLIRNATIWTGRVDGLEIIKGDLLLDKGLVKGLGVVDPKVLAHYGADALNTIDADGAWVSPGYVFYIHATGLTS